MPTTTPSPQLVQPPARGRHTVWLGILWSAAAALFVLDLLSGRDLTLLAYFLLPALVAAIFAPPLQVILLVIVALVSGIVSGWHFGTLFTFYYLTRLGALALTGAFAVWLARAREHLLQTTRHQRDRLRATLDSLLDPHVVLRAVRDASGHITDFLFVEANDAACTYNRLPRAQYVGRRLLDLLPAHTATGLLALYRRVVETGQPLALDDYRYPHDIFEEPRYYDIRAVGLGDELSYTWRDVTDRHRTAEDLAIRARTDELTKLLNRREVFERLEDLRGRSPRTGHHLAVLFVDFDRFKTINDTYGHAAGDEVLRLTADRLRTCLRHADDLGARLGGDELMIVLHGVHGLPDAVAVAEKLRSLAAQPIRFDGTDIPATVSIGVTLVAPGESTIDLIARADQAMYRAKQHGRNQVIPIDEKTSPDPVRSNSPR